MKHHHLIQAILNLRPGAEVSIADNDSSQITVHDDTILPTEAELQAECERLEAEEIATQYQRDRAAAYPTIGDQLDALYHAGVFPADMAALIAAVKSAHPKPE